MDKIQDDTNLKAEKNNSETPSEEDIPKLLGKMNQMILRPAKKFLNNYFLQANNG